MNILLYIGLNLMLTSEAQFDLPITEIFIRNDYQLKKKLSLLS